MGVVLGADGGNSKTELVAASTEGDVLAYLRGPGSNSHAVGSDGTIAVLDELVERARLSEPAEHAVLYLCGADVPADVAALCAAVARRSWARRATIDNDTFAVLRAGTNSPDAIAVVCGSGINCVGRDAGGRVARYSSLGWETGDWGGGDALGREALTLAARAEDGRAEPTALVDVVRGHFGMASAAAVGEAVHYRRLPVERLGELAPAVIAAAAYDTVARGLVDRLADEIELLVERALRDLGIADAEVVLGGGTLREPLLVEAVVARLPAAKVVTDAPVVGAALAALDAAGASSAGGRLRESLRRTEPVDVRG